MNKIGKVISITTILAILTYIFVTPASAAQLGKDGFYYEFENGNAVLKEYHSSTVEVRIPNNVYDYDVVKIADYSFLRKTEITSVVIPDTVTAIGDSAFYGCSNLERALIPASVTTFGSSVFANCEKLTIECYSGSAAEQYAIDNNIPYILIDFEKTTYLYGDVDLDGSITSSDSLKILRKSVRLEEFTEVQEQLADVDGSGISSSDALEVLRYSVRLPVNGNVGEEVLI